jgi:hypothetical protein
MATTLTVIPTGPTSFRLQASSTLPETDYRWFRDGVLYSVGRESFLDVRVSRSSQATFSVLDDEEDADALIEAGVSSGLVIWWTRRESTQLYRVERWTGSEWVLVEIINESGLAVYSVAVEGLADETLHTLRIVAVDLTQQQAVIATRTAFLIRRPDVPPQTFAFDSETGEVTAGG